MDSASTDAARRLSQPDVSPTELTDIAAAFPALRPAVAAHPRCHPELRAWIAQVAPPVPPAPPAPPAPSVAAAPAVVPAPAAASARPARLPWVVAAVAVVVALASVGALVLRGAGAPSGGTERGFAAPADAVEYFVAQVAAGDLAGAGEAFTVRTIVAGYSYQAQAERLRAVVPVTWLPTTSPGYLAVDEGLRRGEVASQLRFFVQAVVAPDRDFTVTQVLDDTLTAADLEAELDPADLAGLSVLRVDEINAPGDLYSENFQAMAAPFGADELREVGILYGTPAGPALGGMQLLRYGDEWFVWNLGSALLGTSVGGLEPMTEQEYVSALSALQE